MELEFVRDCNDTRLYVNVLLVEVCEDQDNDQYPLTLTIDNTDNAVIATRFQGGQRFLLPSSARDQIIDALKCGKSVTVTLSRYKQTFPATNFSNVFYTDYYFLQFLNN